MDLRELMEVSGRHRFVMSVGVVLGVLVALLVTFRVAYDAQGRGKLERRIRPDYSTKALLLISEATYGIGKAGTAPDSTDAFAKTVNRAPTYAELILGDEVIKYAEAEVGRITDSVEAEAVERSPVIEVKVTGDDPTRVMRVARAVSVAFIKYLDVQQEEYRIPRDDRVKVSVLASPTRPRPEKSWSLELGVVAFLVPMTGALGAAVVLDRSRAIHDVGRK